MTGTPSIPRPCGLSPWPVWSGTISCTRSAGVKSWSSPMLSAATYPLEQYPAAKAAFIAKQPIGNIVVTMHIEGAACMPPPGD